MMTEADLERLTPMERQILAFLPTGAQNKEIANALGISDGTVKVHVKAILKKIGARNRTLAAVWITELKPDIAVCFNNAVRDAVAMAIEFSGPLVRPALNEQPASPVPHDPYLRVIRGSVS